MGLILSLDFPEATHEVGGQLSHGAIAAREYGVPALINVNGVTQYIHDGQTFTVGGMGGRST
jgi:pyruvate,water dikinase